jgi:hypothetical protein
MRSQDIQWPLPAGLCTAAILLFAMLTAGCGPGKRALSPEVRSSLKDEPEIIAFRYSFRGVILQKYHKPGTPIADTVRLFQVREEPLIPLMESFLAEVKAELRLDNIRALPEPRHHDPNNRWHLDRHPERTYDLIRIERTFQTGLVFDFDRDPCVFDSDDLTPGVKGRYGVHLSARARLIRANTMEILWQGVCEIVDRGLTLDDFPETSDPSAQEKPVSTIKASALAQEKLDKAVRACAKELTTQFMGK